MSQAVELNLGIAHSMASRFRGRGVEVDDAEAELPPPDHGRQTPSAWLDKEARGDQ